MGSIKQKIFDKMAEYGWNLEDFNEVFETHKKQIDDRWDAFKENFGMLTDEEREKEFGGLCFMTDFLRAINDLEREEDEE